jgi:hypothetical protein
LVSIAPELRVDQPLETFLVHDADRFAAAVDDRKERARLVVAEGLEDRDHRRADGEWRHGIELRTQFVARFGPVAAIAPVEVLDDLVVGVVGGEIAGGMRDEEPLREVAADLATDLKLDLGFDALGNDREADRVRETHDLLEKEPFLLAAINAGNEEAVDLDDIGTALRQ